MPVEFGPKNSPIIYDNRKDAELQIVEYIEDRLFEYKLGERDFEDATTVEEYVVGVTVYPNEILVDEYGRTINYSKPSISEGN